MFWLQKQPKTQCHVWALGFRVYGKPEELNPKPSTLNRWVLGVEFQASEQGRLRVQKIDAWDIRLAL